MGNPTEPGAKVVKITPEMAVEMLETNTANRPVRQNRVNAYAESMKRNRWSLTGETIKISVPNEQGETILIDGQHRLWACVESGCSFETWVVTGVPHEAATFIDSGLPRSMGDVVNLAGMDYSTARAAVARLILGWREGVVNNNVRWQTVVSRDLILDFIRDNYEEQAEALRIAHTIKRQTSGSLTAIAAFVFEIRRINPTKAEEFISAWRDGDNLNADSPIRALRQWILSRSINNKRTENPLYLLVMTKAWNASLVNGTIRKMIVRKDEVMPDLHTGISS